MSETYTPTQAMPLTFDLPDAVSAAELAFADALAFCAGKMRLADTQTARQYVRQGNATARGYFDYALARTLAEHIGALDDEVQEIYLFDPEATPEDTVFSARQPTLIHLLVWVKRKTNALTALLSALDRAVTDQYTAMVGATERAWLLDAQVVDDVEVAARSGFGALVTSLNNRPLMVWKR